MANQQPRLLSYERRAEYVFNNSDSYHGNLSRSPYENVTSSAGPQRSSSFQKRPVQDNFKHNRPRRISNSIAPVTNREHEQPSRYNEKRIEQRMFVNGVLDQEFSSYDFHNHRNGYRPPGGSRDAYSAQRARTIDMDDNTYPNDSHYYSIPNNEYYDNVDHPTHHFATASEGPETDIVDDASDAVSDMYQAGLYRGLSVIDTMSPWQFLGKASGSVPR